MTLPSIIRFQAAGLLAAALLVPLATPANAATAPFAASLTELSTDPYTNSTSQHATEVEPDTYAWGSTIVSAFQVGRFTDGGSSNIGWATSTDSGTTWQHGFLPGTTTFAGGSFARISDPTVAYDARHNTWLIASLAINSSVSGLGAVVSRSTDGGLTWTSPVFALGNNGHFWDKDWITCDNTSTSAFYGHCYVEADDTNTGDTVFMSTSGDGGTTWGSVGQPADRPNGLGGQPLVQPNGTVVVPYLSTSDTIRAFVSTNGGTSWQSSVSIARADSATESGGLRSEPLPSATIDGSGKVYVAWNDCRFRSSCTRNDIVFATSTTGTTWSSVARVPIDATTSSADHFIPGFGADRSTSGSSARLALYYYFYPNSSCSASTCQLEVGYISSTNGGTSWGSAQTVAGPMSLGQLASTTDGPMVGDYIGTGIAGGNAVCVFAVGRAPSGGQAFDEAMYTAGGLPVSGGAAVAGTSTAHGRPNPRAIAATRY